MITDKEAYGLAFTDRLGRRIYKISSLLHEKKNTRVLGPFKAADRFGSGLRQKKHLILAKYGFISRGL